MQITDSVKATARKKEGEERREGGCDKIYNDIINLEKQRGLFDTNTISLTDTLQQHDLVFLYSGTMHSLMLRDEQQEASRCD